MFVASWFRIVQRAWVRVIAVQISVTCGAAEVVGNALNANWPPTIAAGSVKPYVESAPLAGQRKLKKPALTMLPPPDTVN